jgi:serine/threonine-protein kinase
MNRTVALKVLHPQMAKDPQVVSRFKREAQASSQLRAPHTVQVYDFDQSAEGVMYLAMELLQGRSLQAIVASEGPIAPSRLVRILDGIADSLGEAHAQGIVHRDIKPENVFLESRPDPDFVKVLDFGIAKIMAGEPSAPPKDRAAGRRSNSGIAGPALTAAGQTLGTLEYMSPEQLMGGELDGRSDLYSLGILTYEVLTGALPFAAKTPGEQITAHLKLMPPPPSRAAPGCGIPPLLDEIVLKLIAKRREDRYRDAAELRAALARVGRSDLTPSLATPPRQTERVVPIPPTPPRLSRGTLMVIAFALVIAIAGAVVAILFAFSR